MMIVMEFWKFFYQLFHFWFWCNSIIDLKFCIWGNLTLNYSRTKLYFIVIIELIFWIVWILIRRGWCFLAYLMETFFIFFGFEWFINFSSLSLHYYLINWKTNIMTYRNLSHINLSSLGKNTSWRSLKYIFRIQFILNFVGKFINI